MRREAKNLLIAILGFLYIAILASSSAAVDSGPPTEDAARTALYMAEELSMGLDLVPDLLDPFSPDATHEAVSHLQFEPPTFQDPHRLIIDDKKLAPPLPRVPSTWQASAGLLAASRQDEDILIDGQELGTGVNGGVRLSLANQSESQDRTVNAWDVIAIGFNGDDTQGYDPHLLFTPYPYRYEASFASVESNAIHRTQYKRRVRQQFLGIRYIDQSDFIETTGPFFDSLPMRQEAHNRMLGLQAGFDQSWSSGTRFRFSWGAKAGVFYSSADQAGYVYDGTANSLPLLLDCHADLALRIFEQAYLGIGLIGLRLDDQYQSRFAWQAPQSTHQLTILGMQLGFDYTY